MTGLPFASVPRTAAVIRPDATAFDTAGWLTPMSLPNALYDASRAIKRAPRPRTHNREFHSGTGWISRAAYPLSENPGGEPVGGGGRPTASPSPRTCEGREATREATRPG